MTRRAGQPARHRTRGQTIEMQDPASSGRTEPKSDLNPRRQLENHYPNS